MTEYEKAAAEHLARMTELGEAWLEAKAARKEAVAAELHEQHNVELAAFRRAEKKARRDARRAAA